MNIHQVLRDNLEIEEISRKKMRYFYDLQTASDRLQKHSELHDVSSMDLIDLEKHNIKKLRILTQWIGITKPNTINIDG